MGEASIGRSTGIEGIDVTRDVTDFMRRTFLFGDSRPFDEHTSLLGSGIVDSTGILELIDFLETRYNLKFADEELVADNFDSVSKVAHFMAQKLSGLGRAIG